MATSMPPDRPQCPVEALRGLRWPRTKDDHLLPRFTFPLLVVQFALLLGRFRYGNLCRKGGNMESTFGPTSGRNNRTVSLGRLDRPEHASERFPHNVCLASLRYILGHFICDYFGTICPLY